MTSIFKGQEEKFNAIYRTHVKLVFIIALRYVCSEFDAEEVVQRSFVKIYKALGKVEDRGEVALRAWVTRITVNESLLFLREQKRFWLEEHTNAELNDEEHLMEIDIDYELCLKLVRQLPDGYRTVFNLVVIEGYSHKEVAKMLSIKESASRSQLTRARSILREKIEKLYSHGKVVE